VSCRCILSSSTVRFRSIGRGGDAESGVIGGVRSLETVTSGTGDTETLFEVLSCCSRTSSLAGWPTTKRKPL
jgi:hypothetical protein